MSKDNSIQVAAMCPTCGNNDYEVLAHLNGEIAVVKCSTCGLESRVEDILVANGENIEEHAKELGEKLVANAIEDFRKKLKSSTRGNKHIRFK